MSFLSAIAILLSAVLLFPIAPARLQASPPVESETLFLSVEQAKALALENNRDILISRQTVVAALGNVTSEKGKFDPIFDITSSYDKTSEPSASSLVSRSSETRRTEASMGLTGGTSSGAYYDLFRFSVSREKSDSPIQSLSPAYSSRLDMKVGQDILRNFGSKAGKSSLVKEMLKTDIARLTLRNKIADTLLEVEQKYWNFVASEHSHKLAQQNLEVGIDLLERNMIKVREGVLPRLDEIKARSEVAVRRVDLIEAENDFRKAGDELKNLLGLSLETRIEASDLPTADFHERLDTVRLIGAAFSNREELKQALSNVQIAEAERDFRSNQRLPKLAVEGIVSLRGLAGSSNPDRLQFGDVSDSSDFFSGGFSKSVSRVADGDFVSWGARVKMSVPIGNRNAEGLYQVAEAEVSRAVLEYKKTKEAIALEVKDAADMVWSGYRRVEASDIAVNLAAEVLETEKEKYAAGLSTTREVLEAQRDLAEAQSRHIRSVADYKTALAVLNRATGTIIELSGVEIPKKF